MRISYPKSIFKMIRIMAVTVLLILAGVLLLSVTAHGRDRDTLREQKEYYKTIEQEYIKDMRTFLADQGYADSGITMNRIIEADGSLQYVVTIYHRRIEQLAPEGREQLLSRCGEIEFPDKECIFNHKFLEIS